MSCESWSQWERRIVQTEVSRLVSVLLWNWLDGMISVARSYQWKASEKHLSDQPLKLAVDEHREWCNREIKRHPLASDELEALGWAHRLHIHLKLGSYYLTFPAFPPFSLKNSYVFERRNMLLFNKLLKCVQLVVATLFFWVPHVFLVMMCNATMFWFPVNYILLYFYYISGPPQFYKKQ